MNAPKYKVSIAIKKGSFFQMFFVSYDRAKSFVLAMAPQLDFATITELGEGGRRRCVASYSKQNHPYTEYTSIWFRVED